MNDIPRPVATSDDTDFTLTVEDVAQRYEQARHPRTLRTLQRYCKSGHLDALKKPTLLGDMYLVTPQSVERHLAQIEEMERTTVVATGRDEPRSVATSVVEEDKEGSSHQPSATLSDQSRPVATETLDTSRYVVRLESENEFLRGQVVVKDTQIKDLTDRARETNVLIQGLQNILKPLLGGRREHPDVPQETSDEQRFQQ
jgi:hypothetical protein